MITCAVSQKVDDRQLTLAMDAAAIAKAKARLEKAKAAIEAIRSASSLAALEPAWSDYLLAHNGIFSILQQGAKVSSQSRQWFGAQNNRRKNDSLLNYLHRARNADEHDIPSVVVERLGGGISFGDSPAGPGMKISRVEFHPVEGNPVTVVEDEDGLTNVTTLARTFVVCRVYNSLFKQHFDPPTQHLGVSLPSRRPLPLAELGLAYVTGLIAAAERLVQP